MGIRSLLQIMEEKARKSDEKKKDVWREIPAEHIVSVEIILLGETSKAVVRFNDQEEMKREWADLVYTRKVTEGKLLLQTNLLARNQDPRLLLPLANLLGTNIGSSQDA